MNLPLRFTCLLLILASGCQLLPKKKFDLATFTPPNCLPIGPGLYLDQTEIANIHWLEFMFFIRDSLSRKDYELLVPDSTVFRSFSRDSSNFLVDSCRVERAPNNLRSWGFGSKQDSLFSIYRFKESYLRYPGQRYYPVVGIEYHAAKAYCRWRSAAVNEVLASELQKEGKPYRIVTNFHLPSPSEYRLAYAQGHPGKIEWKSFTRSCKAYQGIFPYEKNVAANVQYLGSFEAKPVTTPQEIGYEQVYARPGTGTGFHHLVGNVAEITSNPDSVWGKSLMDVVDPDSIQNSNWLMDPGHRPNFYTGFRCACDVSVVAASTYKPNSPFSDPAFKNDLIWLNAWRLSDSVKATLSPDSYSQIIARRKRYFACEIPIEDKLQDTLFVSGQTIPMAGFLHVKESDKAGYRFQFKDSSIDSIEITHVRGLREIITYPEIKRKSDSTFRLRNDQFAGRDDESVFIISRKKGQKKMFWMEVRVDE